MRRLSLSEARAVAVRSQGLAARPSGRVDVRHLRTAVQGIGLLQLDFVNVLVPSHYLVLFSRVGAYPRERLDQMAYRDRELTEQWAHEACLVPMEAWSLLEHRRSEHRTRPRSFAPFLEAHPEYVERALDVVRERGPLLPEDLPEPEGGPQRLEHAWFGTVRRAVLEHHFGRGRIAIANRLPNFARVYDVVERVVPEAMRNGTPDREDQIRTLLSQAARAHGIATTGDLADYLRIPVADARPRVVELLERGELEEVRVDDWREPTWMHREAVVPRQVEGTSLLSPFDPLIWTRRRTERLFAFDYRFEIFIPAPQRHWGAYVLPFLQDDRLTARVDLKSDRPNKRLKVQGAWTEDHVDPARVAPALAAELRTLAEWLGLEDIEIGDRGDLAPTLAACIRTP